MRPPHLYAISGDQRRRADGTMKIHLKDKIILIVNRTNQKLKRDKKEYKNK